MLLGWLGLWLFGVLSVGAFFGVMASRMRHNGEEPHRGMRGLMLSFAAASDLGGAALAGGLLGSHWLPAAAFGFLFCGAKIAMADALTRWFNRLEAAPTPPRVEADVLRRRSQPVREPGDAGAGVLFWATLGLIDLTLLVFGITWLAYLSRSWHLI